MLRVALLVFDKQEFNVGLEFMFECGSGVPIETFEPNTGCSVALNRCILGPVLLIYFSKAMLVILEVYVASKLR